MTNNFEKRLERRKGAQKEIKRTIKELKSEIDQLQTSLHHHEQALILVRDVGLKTQENLQFHISDITSTAMESVFDNPYKIKMQFIERRGKLECEIGFERNDLIIDPESSSGGGTIDVASFALRMASWALQYPRKDNVIILDEPMKFVSEKYQHSTSQMIKDISKQLGVQFIIVTHNPILTTFADKTFLTTINKKGITKVT